MPSPDAPSEEAENAADKILRVFSRLPGTQFAKVIRTPLLRARIARIIQNAIYEAYLKRTTRTP